MKLFWAPAMCCAVISFVPLLLGARGGAKWWQGMFYAFLPACFLLMGGLMYQMSRDIARLRRRISKLEEKRQPGVPVGPRQETPTDTE
jgi:hypothetical protein